MASANFERVLDEVKTLSHRELERLRNLLDAWLESLKDRPIEPESEEDAVPSDDEFDQEMLKEGILDHVPPPIREYSPWADREPVEIEGEPLSETIMRERR